jgi:tetratricopeptide (TPR) repeat protein
LRDASNARLFAERALSILDKLENANTSMARADALNTLGLAAWLENDLDQAEHVHREALEVRRAFNDAERIQMSLQNLGNVLTLRNNLEAETLFEEAISIAEKLGDVANVARGHANLGYLMIRLERFAEAEALLEHALKVIEPIGEVVIAHGVRNNLGIVRFYQGKFAEARIAYLAAYESPRIAQDKPVLTLMLNNVIETELRLGLYADAAAHLETAFELLHAVPNKALEADLHLFHGELEAIQNHDQQAIAAFHQALLAAREGHCKDHEVTALVRLAMRSNDVRLAFEAARLKDSTITQATVMALSGETEQAHQEILKHNDNFEVARFLQDLTILSGNPTYDAVAQLNFSKLR